MNNKYLNDSVIAESKYNGLQKAAFLLIALKVDVAAEVMKYIDSSYVETLSAEITKSKSVPSNEANAILGEFHGMITAREYVLEGGLEYAQTLLEKTFGMSKASQILERIKSITTLKGFDILKKTDPSQLLNFLNKEHPQTIALILAHLNPAQTADALKELPPDIRSEVVFRIATLGKISPQIVKEVEIIVDEMASLNMGQSLSKLGGTKSVASILNNSSMTVSKELLNILEEKDAEVATEIKKLMFLFEDIITLPDQFIQLMLSEVDRKDLALALKVADDKLKDKILSNMSKRGADLIQEELSLMGMVRLKEVENAQLKIIEVLKKLEETGKITLTVRSAAEEVYV